MKFNKIEVSNIDILEELKNDSALTWEGMNVDDENIKGIFDWILHFTPMKKYDIYIIKGKFMNETYNLKNNKRYPDDLNIVSIKLEDMEDFKSIVLPRFDVGGRWFDDIVNGLEDRF